MDDRLTDERQAVAALIERLVGEANIPGRRARDELRRELESHFEEAGASPEALRAAIERFGSAETIGDGFRRAHRRGRLAFYAAKVAASIVVAAVLALALQLVVNLRVERGAGAMWLAPGYAIGLRTSIVIILLVVAAWELGIEPLCARLERNPARLLTTLGAFFTAISLTHLAVGSLIDPGHALVASAAQVAVWTCTLAVLSRFDLVYLGFLGPRR
ncbi:MAG TPA: hypothetical protein VNA89_10345 [Gemmatimonadaceae bacterium]|nr:hypothetical protein [Gemmatimonadaceae bacterium]